MSASLHVPVRELAPESRGLFAAHLHLLGKDDRRLRFGLSVSAEQIDRYVNRIDLARDALLVVMLADPVPIAAAHLAHGDGFAELAVSVLEGFRGRGLGSALFAEALAVCRRWNVYELFTHCFAGNEAMMQLARKNGMRVVIEGGEADAYRPVNIAAKAPLELVS